MTAKADPENLGQLPATSESGHEIIDLRPPSRIARVRCDFA